MNWLNIVLAILGVLLFFGGVSLVFVWGACRVSGRCSEDERRRGKE